MMRIIYFSFTLDQELLVPSIKMARYISYALKPAAFGPKPFGAIRSYPIKSPDKLLFYT